MAADDATVARLPAKRGRLAGAALPPELGHLAQGEFAEALGKAVGYAHRALSPTTEKIYADDWAAFRAWCQAHGAPYLPAPPAIVAAYLAERAASLGRSGLRLILAAIAYHHRRAGQLWSAGDPVIATVLRGILRAQRRPVRPAAALTSSELRQLLAGCGADPATPAGLAGVRDRALLLVGFAGGLRRSELVALDREDLRFTADGLVLRIRHAKTDQEGAGAEVVIARGRRPETCPVRALEAWLRRAGIGYGAVFRRLTRNHLQHQRCVIPAAGFYEWREEDGKQPYYFSRKNGCPLMLAGIWQDSEYKGDQRIAFAILTDEPNELVAPYHDRMPQALADAQVAGWLALGQAQTLQEDLLLDLQEFSVRPMNRVMNNAREKDLARIDPAAA